VKSLAAALDGQKAAAALALDLSGKHEPVEVPAAYSAQLIEVARFRALPERKRTDRAADDLAAKLPRLVTSAPRGKPPNMTLDEYVDLHTRMLTWRAHETHSAKPRGTSSTWGVPKGARSPEPTRGRNPRASLRRSPRAQARRHPASRCASSRCAP
jgi:hypothetical protein